MVSRTAILAFVLCSASAIRVPVDWNSDSEVTNKKTQQSDEDNDSENNVPIPIEYFHYPDQKPQFAVDVATFHNVRNPQNHYTSYPVRPYTGRYKPTLGNHKILNEPNPVFDQLQQFTHINDNNEGHVKPSSTDYEVFHPYKAEEQSLQEVYKDPVLHKIRNDIYNTQNRLQNYENDAGKSDIEKNEYLETPEDTDRRKFPHRNVPVPYEIHRPQRKPIYYRPTPNINREHVLNQKFRHPWNQYNAKIRPIHYRPLKFQIHKLRQHHALTFDDEKNEYPQLSPTENYAEVPDGYDIFERGKAKYVALRNNVDESINNAVTENRPVLYRKLEAQNNGKVKVLETNDEGDDEFIPVKNYAQVRKTETMRHLPRKAAFEDAENLDEIRNAPRLREAIKSTKAQTVYTEEGYEDAAYDHAGEEKHAAENEGHGGYLKEKEISGGKYKTPSQSGQYQDGSGNEYRDQTLHGEKWKNDDNDNLHESEEEEYTDDDTEQSIESDVYEGVTGERNKRNNLSDKSLSNSESAEEQISSESVAFERSKRENKNKTVEVKNNLNTTNNFDFSKVQKSKFKIPVLNLNTTFLTGDDILKLANLKVASKKDNIKEKYPYYFKNLKNIHKDSPLRYAENLKFIPKKSKGGTEFYDSRFLKCPEVDDEVDPLPRKLKTDGHPDGNSGESDENNGDQNKNKADFSQLKKNQHLKGLGDKIDCFKVKFFGENPLDSPFFKEGIISNPEPITKPNLPVYQILSKDPLLASTSNVFNISEALKENTKLGLSSLFDTLKGEQKSLQDELVTTNQKLRNTFTNQNFSSTAKPHASQQLNIYSDILESINNNRQMLPLHETETVSKHLVQPISDALLNITYSSFNIKEDVTQLTPTVRKKRSTFVYEPYKIIRDGQIQESKKTTTTSNISPLIKKLQSSRVVDKVSKYIPNANNSKASSRTYKNIDKNDRMQSPKISDDSQELHFVDVNIDQRRGEPRYEIRIPNHKSEYTPVTNKKTMSVEDYQAKITNTAIQSANNNNTSNDEVIPFLQSISSTARSRQRQTTTKPYFDVSQFIPKPMPNDIQKPSASNTIKQIVKRPNVSDNNKKSSEQSKPSHDDQDDDEDYEEYDEDEVSTTTTTTSTEKPSFRRRRIQATTSTPKPTEEPTPYPKLRLITRFHSTQSPLTTEKGEITTIAPIHQEDDYLNLPKYREKKKKSTKSTLVTDTKSYGEDNSNDKTKDEVDAMIGVKQDMDEYTPQYEKIDTKRNKPHPPSSSSDEEDDDEMFSEEDDDDFDEDDDDEDEDDDDDDSSEDELQEELPEEPVSTTPEPTKRTLIRTTEAPISTTETRNAKLVLQPIVHKKKIEIHKEIPANKSNPNVTQFRQDIKEIEIIKEMPAKPKLERIRLRKPQKHVEALELYKDETLAEEVNKLGAVEVFKENLDLEKGPKHGGNYRSAQINLQDVVTENPARFKNTRVIKDPDTSQSKNSKSVDFGGILPARRLRGSRRQSEKKYNGEINTKLELGKSSSNDDKILHEGNLKLGDDKKVNKNRNAKIIELEDDNDSNEENTYDERNTRTYDTNKSSGRSLHGGNYRSARITENTSPRTEKVGNSRSKSAVLLNSFAQAVPILTSTPTYILDPSKRMYYYVED